jgi:hypothetical protein
MATTPKPLIQRQLDYLAQQRWQQRGIRVLLQGLGLGLSLCAIGLGTHLVFNISLSNTLLAAVLVGCIILGVVMLLRPRLSSRQVAQRLDQRFGLQEQITTALEVQERGETEGVAAYLIQKASHNTTQVQRYATNQQRFPWAEVIMLVALLIMTGGLLLLVSLNPTTIAHTTPLPLPPLVSPDSPPQEFPEEPFDPPPGSNPGDTPGGEQPGDGQAQAAVALTGVDQQSLSAIADELRDLSVMRPAAEALDQGDTAGAAQSIREVADQADQLSPETRRDIANGLREAANTIGQNDPNLANRLRESAQDIEQDMQGAAQGLDKLASTIEKIGKQDEQIGQMEPPPDQQNPADAPQSWEEQGQANPGNNDTPPEDQRERARPHERLGVEGVPLELENDGEGDTPTNNEADSTADNETGAGGFRQGDQLSDDTQVDVGDDPLRIPVDLRDVVQGYFSPSN